MTKPQSSWPTYNLADLRHQVQIQALPANPPQDALGQPQLTNFATIRATSAGKNLVSVKEAWANNQATSETTDVWTMRWTPVVIKPGMQIVFGSETYKIQGVTNVAGRNLWLHVLVLQLNATSSDT